MKDRLSDFVPAIIIAIVMIVVIELFEVSAWIGVLAAALATRRYHLEPQRRLAWRRG